MPESRHRKTGRARKRPKGLGTGKSVGTTSRNQKRVKALAAVIGGAIVLSIVGYLLLTRADAGKEVTTASGLKYQDLVEGTGPSPQLGRNISVSYIGKLENGKEFNNTHGQAMDFVFGDGKLIPGWIEGLRTMKVGGTRRLTVPPKLGYGAQDQPGIPPNSTLIFDVELKGVK